MTSTDSQLAFDLTAKVAQNYKREGTSQRAAAYAARSSFHANTSGRRTKDNACIRDR